MSFLVWGLEENSIFQQNATKGVLRFSHSSKAKKQKEAGRGRKVQQIKQIKMGIDINSFMALLDSLFRKDILKQIKTSKIFIFQLASRLSLIL